MNLIKKITSISLAVLVLLFFSVPALNSCSGKDKSTESTEQTTGESDEHPTGDAEQSTGDNEHPTGGDEHPTSDTTATE
jgi:hypothetical protein